MAIFEDVPGLSVIVHVDGTPAGEYDDDDDAGAFADILSEYKASITTSKYIESISEKNYCVQLKVGPAFDFNCPALLCDIWIDGQVSTGTVIRKSALANGKKEFAISGAEENHGGGRAVLSKFKFGKININESNTQNVKKDSKLVAKIGEIVVKFYRASDPIVVTSRPDPTKSKHAAVANVHEKAMKGQAKSHSTLYEPPVEIARDFVLSDKLDGKDHPKAIFKFKYRSREALKQLLVLPRTPSPEPEPEPAPNSMNVEGLDHKQREQLAKFMKELTGANQRARIKREHDQDGNGEGSHKRRKSGKKVIIDLTGDSDEEN